MSASSGNLRRPAPVAILVNGPSSSGKSTLCRALQDSLVDLADGNPDAAFARVAFDDVGLLLSKKLYPVSFVQLQGGDLTRLVSRAPHDGRAAWEYINESHVSGPHGGGPRLRLVFNPHGRKLLAGIHRSWGQHLALGTNLVIDHFLQDEEWKEEILGILRDSGARVFFVGVFCSVAELERRESSRAGGEVRPLGLARRSDELCHAHDLDYNITVRTDEQSTTESVEAIMAAMQGAGLLL